MWPFVLLTVLMLAAAGWYFRPRPQSKAGAATAGPTARVIRGILQRTIRLTGSITTRNFATITAPLLISGDSSRGQVLIYLPPSGSDVKKNDVIARIDGEAIEEHLNDVDAQVIQMGLNMRGMEAQQTVRAENYRQRARVAKATLEKAKLNARTAPVRNQIEQETLQLAVEEAQMEYEEAQRQIAMQAESEQSALLLSQYNYDFQIRHRGRHRDELARSTIRSPIDGKVVLRAITRNGEFTQVRVGDEVFSGQAFMRVVDVSGLQMEGQMSQTDSETVRLGQKAKVRFDAYPDLVMDGHVEAVGALAMTGRRVSYYIRRIPVRIAIEGSDPRVIPDLTASADVVIGEGEDGLIIPRDAVQESGGKLVVFVKQGETVTPREVELGAFSSTQVSVIAGLQEGEEIALHPDK